MPFGLFCAPAKFQQLMDHVLDYLQHKCAVPYIDDILVYSSKFKEQLEHLNEVLSRLRQAGLKLKPVKCSFIRRGDGPCNFEGCLTLQKRQ